MPCGSFLENDAIEALDGTAKFHARVAANVLAIARASWRWSRRSWRRNGSGSTRCSAARAAPADLRALRRRVRARTEQLCERIRRGDADAGTFRDAVLAHVRATVCEKLAIANPKLLAAEESSR